MGMEELLNLILNNGFAIVMCVYMMVVNTKTVQENTLVTQKMNDLLEELVHHKTGGVDNE